MACNLAQSGVFLILPAVEFYSESIRFLPMVTWSFIMVSTFPVRGRSALSVAWSAFWLLVVGGLNWGLVGLFRVDLVAMIFGPGSIASRFIYALVGLAAVYCAITMPALRKPAMTN